MDNLDLLLKLARAGDEETISKIISNHSILLKDEKGYQ
jgi:hypothetical protein